MARYEGTNITGEKVVNRPKMQLNDALIESYDIPAIRMALIRIEAACDQHSYSIGNYDVNLADYEPGSQMFGAPSELLARERRGILEKWPRLPLDVL